MTTDNKTPLEQQRYLAHQRNLNKFKFKMRIYKKIRPAGKIILSAFVASILLGFFIYLIDLYANIPWLPTCLSLIFLFLSLLATVLKYFSTYGIDVPLNSTKTEVQKSRRNLYNSAKYDAVIMVNAVMSIVSVIYSATPATKMTNLIFRNTQEIIDIEDKLECLEHSVSKKCTSNHHSQKY